MSKPTVPMIIMNEDGTRTIIQPEDIPYPRFAVKTTVKNDKEIFVIADLYHPELDLNDDSFVFTGREESATYIVETLNFYGALDRETKQELKVKFGMT